MTTKTNTTLKYLENWPAHYFEIKPASRKREILLQRLASAEDPGDRRRLELLDMRYDKDDHDLFLRGLVNLSVTSPKPNFLNKKTYTKFVWDSIRDLHLEDEQDEYLLAEWQDVCGLLLKLDMQDQKFSSGTLGILKLKSEKLAFKMAEQADTITRIIPEIYGVEEYFVTLREIMAEAYCRILEDGDEYWQAYLSSLQAEE